MGKTMKPKSDFRFFLFHLLFKQGVFSFWNSIAEI
jgi:hypothetical protein